MGSTTAIWFGIRIAAKFSGVGLVPTAVLSSPHFLSAMVLGAAGMVFLAARLGLPISTTHSLIGALVGAGVMAAGYTHLHFSVLGKGIIAPLIFSPVLALLLTLGVRWAHVRFRTESARSLVYALSSVKLQFYSYKKPLS